MTTIIIEACDKDGVFIDTFIYVSLAGPRYCRIPETAPL